MKTSKSLPVVIIIAAVVLAAGAALWMRANTNTRSGDEGIKDPLPKPGPVTPVANAGSGGQVRGNPNAKATLVEYGDFQCPSCGYYYPMVEELLKEAPDLVKLEFHHYPLIELHRNALPAALAAEAAAEQGKFWEMYDLLFRNQSVWSTKPNARDDFVVMAQRIGLDTEKFKKALDAPETKERVGRDVAQGSSAGVRGTPTFFVNGQMLEPVPSTAKAFRQAIEERAASK